MNFSKTNLTKNNLPIGEVFFVNMKNKILGPKYELSLVCIGDTRARKLNQEFRKKDYVPNILSFPLTKSSGEIFLNLNQIKKETQKFNLGYTNLTIFMFIHGCLHLKGLEHGDGMEKMEQKLFREFKK